MPAARPAAGHHQQLVIFAGRNDLVQQWQDYLATPVDDALPTQLDDIQIREWSKNAPVLGALQQGLIHQRLTFQL